MNFKMIQTRIIALFLFFIPLFSFATDSTSVLPSTAAPIKVSYVLYASPKIYLSVPASGGGTSTTMVMGGLSQPLRCVSGYAACVFVQITNYDSLKSSSGGYCSINQVLTNASIDVAYNGYYNVTLLGSIRTQGGSGGCNDRGYKYIYTIFCIPNEQVAIGNTTCFQE